MLIKSAPRLWIDKSTAHVLGVNTVNWPNSFSHDFPQISTTCQTGPSSSQMLNYLRLAAGQP